MHILLLRCLWAKRCHTMCQKVYIIQNILFYFQIIKKAENGDIHQSDEATNEWCFHFHKNMDTFTQILGCHMYFVILGRFMVISCMKNDGTICLCFFSRFLMWSPLPRKIRMAKHPLLWSIPHSNTLICFIVRKIYIIVDMVDGLTTRNSLYLLKPLGTRCRVKWT